MTEPSQSPLPSKRASRPSSQDVPGYTYGSSSIPKAPIDLQEFELLKGAVMFGPDDVRYLRRSGEILADQIEDVLDVWYGFVGSTPQLIQYFGNVESGEPDPAYLAAVRKRFGQWIIDTAQADYDQAWLDYQFEIGVRHHRIGKNRTDHAPSVPIIHFRYMFTLHFAVTATLRPFLEKKAEGPEEVEGMLDAWRKSALLQVILWSYPYIKEGDF